VGVKSHYAQKRDANESAIVDALIENGFEVLRCNGLPFDLIVGRNAWCIFECKGPAGRLTESQERFFANGHAPRFVVRTVEEALELAGRYC
jgi:hypothetical protein